MSTMENKYCSIQNFEVLNEDMLPVDAIDKAVNCIRLRWNRSKGFSGVQSCAKELSLVKVKSIRWILHLVRGDGEIPLL